MISKSSISIIIKESTSKMTMKSFNAQILEHTLNLMISAVEWKELGSNEETHKLNSIKMAISFTQN